MGHDQTTWRDWARSWVAGIRPEADCPSLGLDIGHQTLAPVAAAAGQLVAGLRAAGLPWEHLGEVVAADCGLANLEGFVVDDLFAADTVGGAERGGGRLGPPSSGWLDPWLLGLVHEQAASAADRSNRGAWYTPPSVVRGLVDLVFNRMTSPDSATSAEQAVVTGPTINRPVPTRVVDPTCGGGAFLLAALDQLAVLGVEPAEAVGRVVGVDIDPGAVAVSRWSILAWAARHGVELDRELIDVRCGDAFLESAWSDDDQPIMVVGNPPFASPLKRGAIPETAERFRHDHTDRLGPYADLASLHLLAMVDRVPRGSVVALVQPQSVLSGRDGEPLRRYLDTAAPLGALWVAREQVFDAGVRACAVVVEVGGRPAQPVALAAGLNVAPVASDGAVAPGAAAWADRAAQALGAPSLPDAMQQLNTAPARDERPVGRLGELASATAGFRDEFYGLVAACREEIDLGDRSAGFRAPRLVTVGLVDPLHQRWGQTPCRFGGRSWERPVIDLAAIETERVRAWTGQRLRPKLVVATQSPVLEPVIDRDGCVVPATPLLSVEAAEQDLDRLAAVLLAPPVTVWAWRRWFGSALAVDALKLAARQVESLPLPADAKAWDDASALVAAIDQEHPDDELIVTVARLMNRAYGAHDDVLDWWQRRLARLRSRRDRPRPTAFSSAPDRR